MNHEAEIRALIPRAREVLDGLSADQINWRFAEGSWSIAECIAHLITTNRQYASSIAEAIQNARREGWMSKGGQPSLGLLERWFLNAMEPPYKLKFKAPALFRPESTHFDRDDLLTDWTAVHEQMAELAREAEALDVKRTKVASPAMPRLKVSLLWCLLAMPAHDRRHLWQAGKIRERLP